MALAYQLVVSVANASRWVNPAHAHMGPYAAMVLHLVNLPCDGHMEGYSAGK